MIYLLEKDLYLVKSVKVRLIPMEKQSPTRKRRFPMAIKEVSKKSAMPKRIKSRPRQINPIPIFWLSSIAIN